MQLGSGPWIDKHGAERINVDQPVCPSYRLRKGGRAHGGVELGEGFEMGGRGGI